MKEEKTNGTTLAPENPGGEDDVLRRWGHERLRGVSRTRCERIIGDRDTKRSSDREVS